MTVETQKVLLFMFRDLSTLLMIYVLVGCEYRVWYISMCQICLYSKVVHILGVSNNSAFIGVQNQNVGFGKINKQSETQSHMVDDEFINFSFYLIKLFREALHVCHTFPSSIKLVCIPASTMHGRYPL